MFVAPNWFEGLLINIVMYIVIPLVLAAGIGIVFYKKFKGSWERFEKTFFGASAVFMIAFIVMLVAGSVFWYNTYEVPSVQEKIITVSEWQPKAGISTNDDGLMIIDNAGDLMMITTEQEGFFNEENLYFKKFNTRDILLQLKVNGTYRIKYYGWRNGFNSGFPNILSVEEVIDESNAVDKKLSDYFGTKLV
jgi:hypothetical protein